MIGILKTCFAPEASPGPAAKAAPDAGAARDARASALLGWTALAVVLAAGVPIFLCMPVWFDTYHYDLCIRKLLRGGVLYRDVFDNNLPGIVWLQGAVRLLVGWRTDAIRLVDLAFFSGGVALLLAWVPRGARVWTAAALYAFYLFLPESCACERDFWMLWPAVVGLTLRRLQVRRLTRGRPAAGTVVLAAFVEGLFWAAGVWIKPFVFVPGLACWLVSLIQIRRAGRGRLASADTGGLLAGGLVAGALGMLWLWRSGSWPYFYEIVFGWNRDYAAFTNRIRLAACMEFLATYLPWSAVGVAAVCLGVAAIRREVVDGPAPVSPSGPARTDCALLAAFYLGWLFQAIFLQLPHDYPVAAGLIPGIALVGAAWRPRPGPSSLVGFTARACLLAVMALCWTAAFRLDRVAHWAECCREGSTPHMQSLLSTRKEYAYCPDPESLAAVEDYLRGQGVGDGDVTCFSGCTHPLYLDMNLEPSTRFNQIEMTALFFVHHRDDLLTELNASHQRFIVADLLWTGLTVEQAEKIDPDDPLALPPDFPYKFALTYPWNEPIVFRSGRFLVHRATVPAVRFWREDSLAGADALSDYAQFDGAALSFRDEDAARKSVDLIDDLYRRSERAGDAAGRHEARLAALTMCDRARGRQGTAGRGVPPLAGGEAGAARAVAGQVKRRGPLAETGGRALR